jgi:hypothetical protein
MSSTPLADGNFPTIERGVRPSHTCMKRPLILMSYLLCNSMSFKTFDNNILVVTLSLRYLWKVGKKATRDIDRMKMRSRIDQRHITTRIAAEGPKYRISCSCVIAVDLKNPMSVSSPRIYLTIGEKSRRACHIPKRLNRLDKVGMESASE